MMNPQAYECLINWRQQQLLEEAAAARLAAAVQPRRARLRTRVAASLYELAAWLSAEMADAVADARTSAAIRAIATCDGVEYWRPMTPLPR
jgi:hypothetical protein